MKKLYRSKNRMVFGVCGGIGEYYKVDATVLRVITMIGIVLTGVFPGVLVYVLAAVIIPDQK